MGLTGFPRGGEGRRRLAVAHCRGKDTGGGGPREYWLAWALPDLAPPKSMQALAQGHLCQTNSRIGTEHHPSADRLPKVVLSSQPPINTPLYMVLPTRGNRPSSTHRGQAPVPPTRKPAQAPGPTSPTRGQTPEARGTTILQPVERRPQREKVRQKTAEKYVPDEGTK